MCFTALAIMIDSQYGQEYDVTCSHMTGSHTGGEPTMPKQTFFNLPEAKRKTLIELSLEEFAEHGPTAASISRIVARAGIAKGSLYQYFVDKQDLHLYLVDLANAERIAFMQGLRKPCPDESFYAYLRYVMEQQARFRFSDPRFRQILHGALYADHSGRLEATRRIRETIADVWRRLLPHGITRGEIDRQFDPEFIVWAFTSLTLDLNQYILAQPGITTEQYTDRYFGLFRHLVRLLEHGLRPHNKEL